MSDFWLHCDNCKRTDVGVTWVNGFRYCGKCYQETFGASKDWQLLDKDKTITEQRKQITDLEAKLAESEKNVEFYQERYSDATTSAYGADLIAKNIQSRLEEEIRQLKQQLAEKEHELDIRTFEAEMNAITITKMRESKHQDKISFAVEQLDKVKAELVNKVSPVKLSYNEYVQEVFNKLNNQIEELKKEMK